MHVIEARNVRDALLEATRFVLDFGITEESRAGPVIAVQQPITIRYRKPKEHVLLNPIRDANPFFHLMEAMWMLAGRDDAAFLEYYIKDFAKMFGKDGMIMDAYGQRWKYGNGYNQLDTIVNLLRKEPTSRQAVLQMWGAGRDDLRAYSSKPCNLSATFRIQQGLLNMTVFNRSNDLIWGCCGANAVHFPILQEYLAGRIGVGVGEYWQVTTNLHMYIDMYERLRKRGSMDSHPPEPYEETMPLMEYPLEFGKDLRVVMDYIDAIQKDPHTGVEANDINNPFLRDVVVPMATAHCLFKQGDKTGALEAMEPVPADDWHLAGCEWLERRNGRGS